jgi:hypothetical protein
MTWPIIHSDNFCLVVNCNTQQDHTELLTVVSSSCVSYTTVCWFFVVAVHLVLLPSHILVANDFAALEGSLRPPLWSRWSEFLAADPDLCTIPGNTRYSV